MTEEQSIWIEHVPGILWSAPLADDTPLFDKILELGLTAQQPVVAAFPDYRLVVVGNAEGQLELLMAHLDGNFYRFRNLPA